MFPNPSSPYNGLAKVILVLVGIGLLVGFALTNSDLTNFITNSAKAKGIEQAVEIQTQKDAIDIKNYEAIQNATTQAQKDKIAADNDAYGKSVQQKLDFQNQASALELEMSRLFNYAKIFTTIILTLSFSFLIILLGWRLSILIRAKTQMSDPWQNRNLRKEMILLARQREQISRATFLHQQPVSAFYTVENAPIPWEGFQPQSAEKI
jgi:hypothetical protein